MRQEPLLEISNLSVSFGGFQALKSIGFRLERGGTLGIVGESGSGKSVTSLSVMRLLSRTGSVDSGAIRFAGKEGPPVDLLSLSEAEMRSYRGNRIAMIFQEPMTSLNPVITCGKQVAEALILHKGLSRREARERTIQLFEKVRLPRPAAIFDSYPHQVSGGQKQRVMIAMAISCDPELLIADEPTTALDVTVQKSILELLKDLQQENGMGMIFISHDLGVIASVADEVAVMYKGNLLEYRPAAEIFRDPRHPYTRGLLACRPPVDRELKALPTIADFMDSEGDNLTARARSIPEILDSLQADKDLKQQRRARLYEKEPLLQVRSLEKHYSQGRTFWGKPTAPVKAVDNVSFSVYPGETLGLVGESGCGKTTLGRTILRLIEPSAGEVIYKGRNILDLDARSMRSLRRHMQIIFQDPYSSLNPRITAGEAIMEPMSVHRVLDSRKARKKKTLELLERVSLSEQHFNRYPHEFSGGQRQRICIARALALSPEFIICDESVSALDVSVQAQVLNLLNELKADFGFTYIFISHDLSVVRYMSDRLMVMNKGIIEEIGDPDEIYTNPSSEYTRKLIAAIPHISL